MSRRDRRVTRRGSWIGAATVALAVLGLLARSPRSLAGQEGSKLEIGGLLRTGLRVDPEETGRNDGFEIFDAQVSLAGEVGLVFDYFLRGAFDTEENTLRLLDARLDVPIVPELAVGVGQFRPAFGLEALQDEGDFVFLERSQASEAIAPGRQIGVELFGEALEGRLTYGGGIFNGNGATLDNDDGGYLYAARAEFNSIGPIEFYSDLVIQVGASIAYSEDGEAPLGRGLFGPLSGEGETDGEDPGDGSVSAFAGQRWLWSADLYASYRGFTLTAEYLRGDYEPASFGVAPVELDAYGGYVQGSYSAWGAIEGVVRYDGFHPAVGENRDFLLVGLNVYPGYYAKFALQYALRFHSSEPAPTVAGNQFILLVQLDFLTGL